MTYKSYTDATEAERKAIYDQVLTLSSSTSAMVPNPACWATVRAVEVMEPVTVVERYAQKGDTYWEPGTHKWVVRDDPNPTRFRVLVKTRDESKPIPTTALTDADIGRRVQMNGPKNTYRCFGVIYPMNSAWRKGCYGLRQDSDSRPMNAIPTDPGWTVKFL